MHYCQKVLLLPSIHIGEAEEGFYRDEQFSFAYRHPTIDEHTNMLESYLKELATDKPESDDNRVIVPAGNALTRANVRKRQIGMVFSEKITKLLLEHMGPYREHILHMHPQKNVLSIAKLLEMRDISNAERLALYTMYCDDMTDAKKDILIAAGKEGLNAELVIHLLEDYRVSEDTKERFWTALQIIRDDSEYEQRMRFARELLEKRWYIKGNYCGEDRKFQLVPIDEFECLVNQMESALSQGNVYFDSSLAEYCDGDINLYEFQEESKGKE